MTVTVAAAPGRAIGVDLGSRRIGVAVSDSGRTVATPRTTIDVGDGDVGSAIERLVALVDETGATAVVVGLPLSMDGRRRQAARGALEAAERLRSALGERPVVVEVVDERLTTVTAQRSLTAAGRSGRQQRRVVDQTAAAVLLQAWIDRGRGR